MKISMLIFALGISISNVLAQNEPHREAPVIKVPDFADPAVESFYNSYADHLSKCIKAIREKNEAKAIELFKNPGEQLVAKEKKLAKEVVKDPVEKQKYIQFANQAYPYLKELQASAVYKKIYGNK